MSIIAFEQYPPRKYFPFLNKSTFASLYFQFRPFIVVSKRVQGCVLLSNILLFWQDSLSHSFPPPVRWPSFFEEQLQRTFLMY